MSNQLQITGGAKVRNLQGVITGTSGVLSSVPLGGANGVATLDSGGKVPVSQLPSSVVTYLGTWNAATNTPTLTNGTGDAGDMYICNVAGTVNFGAGPITFAVGDWVLYGSGTWQKSNGQNGTVTSVGLTASGGSNALTITNSPITTAGNINIGFAGSSTQYIAGDGTLVTFPTIITEAQNLITDVYNETGATLTKGTVVYINGGHGNLPTVTKAIATGDATSAQTYGVVQADITNNNNGHVVVIGSLGDLDTQAYAAGTQLYLSSTTAGAWTSTKQYAPAHLVYVGIVVRSHPTQGVVEVKIQNGFELDELHNVSAQNPNNGDILQYNTSTNLWTSVAGTTTNIAEGTNLYYTDARSRAAFSETVTGLDYNSTTGVLSTTAGYGIPTTANQTNWTTAYNDSIVSAAVTGTTTKTLTLTQQDGGTVTASWSDYDTAPVTSVFGRTGAVTAQSGDYTTTQVTEGTNLYFTDARARGAISLTTTGTSGVATYNSTTGVLNIPNYSETTFGTVTSVALAAPTGFSVTGSPVTSSGTLTLGFATGYSLPTNASQANWDTAYTNRITSASAPLSIASNAISISQATSSTDGYLSSIDWTTFNGKIGGSGTAFYVPRFSTGGATLINSGIYDDGTTIIFTRNLSGPITFTGLNTFTGGILSTDYYRVQQNSSIATAPSGYSTFGAINTKLNFGVGVGASTQKVFQFETSGLTNNTTRVYTLPDASGTLALTSDLSSYVPTSRTLTINGTAYDLSADRTWSVGTLTGGGADGRVAFWNGASNVVSDSLFVWDDTNNRLGIGLVNPQRALEVYSATADSHVRLSGAAPSVSMGEAITGSIYQAKFGLATASGQFVSGSVAGDFVISNQTGSTIWAYNSSEKMRLNTNGRLLLNTTTDSGYLLDVNGTGRFSGQLSIIVPSGTAKMQIGDGSVSGGSYINLMGVAAAKTWFIANNYNIGGGLEFIQSTTNGGTTPAGSAAFSLASTGAATFSSSVTANGGFYLPSGGSGTSPTISYLNSLTYGLNASGGNAGIYFGNTYNSDYSTAMQFRVVNSGGTNVTAMTLTPSGNVGIGTSSLGSWAKLQVVGNIATTGTGYYWSSDLVSGATPAYLEYNYGSSQLTIGSYGASANGYTIFTTGGSTERMRITSGGYVLVGYTSAPSVAGLLQTTSAYVGSLGTGIVYSLSGVLTSTNPSDLRLKDNIEDLGYGLKEILQLRPVKYNWKNNNANQGKQFGFIAQEVQEVMPELVTTFDTENGERLGLEKEGIYAALVQAIKELKAEIDELKNK